MDVSNPTKQGSRRVEIKKEEEESKRLVTFTKRRKCLFNKTCELSELSGAKRDVFVISKQGKPYSCGDVDSILDQNLTGKVSDSNSESNAASLEVVELMRKECEETLLKLEEETTKQRGEEMGFWREKSVDETVEWLKEYEAPLVQLKRNVEGKLEEMRRKKAEASTSSVHDHDHQGVIPTAYQLHHDLQVRDHDHDYQGVIPTVDQLHHDYDHQSAIPTVDQLHHDGLAFDDPYRIEDFVGLNEFLNLVG